MLWHIVLVFTICTILRQVFWCLQLIGAEGCQTELSSHGCTQFGSETPGLEKAMRKFFLRYRKQGKQSKYIELKLIRNSNVFRRRHFCFLVHSTPLLIIFEHVSYSHIQLKGVRASLQTFSSFWAKINNWWNQHCYCLEKCFQIFCGVIGDIHFDFKCLFANLVLFRPVLERGVNA